MPKRRKDQKTSDEKIIRAEQTQKALALRKRGASYRAIAEALGVSEPTAYRRVRDALDVLHEENLRESERLRDLELARCDYWQEKLDPGIMAGDPRSVNAAVRVSERRSKLTGIDEPTAFKLDLDELAERTRAGDAEALRLLRLIATGRESAAD